MARAKSWIWISLALVCALGAAGLTYYLLQRQNSAAAAALALAQEERANAPKEATVSIPVASRDLERGLVLAPELFDLKEFPLSLAPSSAITDTALLDGQTLAQFVAQGDIFRPQALYGGTGAPLSSSIAPGRTIITFPVLDLFSGTGLFVEGDRVDLLLSIGVETTAEDGEGAGDDNITGYTVQNVRVMRTLTSPPSQDNPNPPPSALLLELDPADAVMVKKVKDAGGTIDLALRSPVDEENFAVPVVTDGDLIRLMSGSPPATVGNAP
jgi:pilus assembly protein CpaB